MDNGKGIKTALKCSEVQRQAPEFEKNSAADLTETSDLFSLADVPVATPDTSSKELQPSFEETQSSRKAGRPKGAKNKSTKEWVEYFMTTVKESPLIALGRLYAQDTVQLARKLQCKREDAMKMQISAAVAVLPYVHQKQPLAIETTSEELPTINIFASPTLFQQFNNGNGQVKKQIIVDGVASTTAEEISLNNNNLALEDKREFEK